MRAVTQDKFRTGRIDLATLSVTELQLLTGPLFSPQSNALVAASVQLSYQPVAKTAHVIVSSLPGDLVANMFARGFVTQGGNVVELIQHQDNAHK